MLHIRRFGEGSPLLALHGFTLTGAQFEPCAAALNREIIAPDLPGHGNSGSSSSDIGHTVTAIAEILDTFDEPVPILGYSQGARLALLVAATTDASIDALVLVSGTAGIQDSADRSRRAAADATTAEAIRSQGIEGFLERWTTTGLTSTDHLRDDQRATDMAVRSTNTADGLAAALVGYGQGQQPSVWDQLGGIETPTLLVTGSTDSKYTSLNDRMAQLLPHARHDVIAGAGHNPLAETPKPSYTAIRSFLDGLG
ncbi:MAG: alpha/beta fold hydrolase [Acidimicrobiia bacterium]